ELQAVGVGLSLSIEAPINEHGVGQGLQAGTDGRHLGEGRARQARGPEEAVLEGPAPIGGVEAQGPGPAHGDYPTTCASGRAGAVDGDVGEHRGQQGQRQTDFGAHHALA
ncbi:hypothetical protein, partial [Fibrivirga algicola]|uniref:hypothetical protein n=1 Tax=Fibrivirga algicola TaxID=2950420 RepID=UPI0014193110